jgi:hypothetical protein
MAGKKTIDNKLLEQALTDYCQARSKEADVNYSYSKGEDGKYVIMPGDIFVWIEDGRISTSDQKAYEKLAGICMDLLENEIKGSNLPAKKQNGTIVQPSQVNAAQAIQLMQGSKDLVYSVGKSKAPTATAALMAATDTKINLEEINKIHTDNFVSSTIRATGKNGRFIDATVSLIKADFINLIAWKIVEEQDSKKNCILDDTDPMNIALPNGFPKIKSDAMISVQMKGGKDNIESGWVKRRAIVHIFITATQQWIFQQRQCMTKAKRNAIIQMLTSSGNPMEVMDEEELADEQMEVGIVEGLKA